MRWSEIPRNPSPKVLQQFAMLSLVFFGAAGGYRWFRGDQGSLPLILLGLGIALAILGFVSPRWLKPIFVGWMIMVFPIGWLISHVILALIFFGIFTPLGYILKLCGHDPLLLRKPNVNSYWQVKEQQKDLTRYLKQF